MMHVSAMRTPKVTEIYPPKSQAELVRASLLLCPKVERTDRDEAQKDGRS